MEWEKEFRIRMQEFSEAYPGNGLPVSIKFRIGSGCFHRDHSPKAYFLIDQAIKKFGPQFEAFALVEHETGPEFLVRTSLVTAGLTLATAILQLIVAIMQARAVGISQGDRPNEPVEVIIRTVDEAGRYEERVILHKGYQDPIRPDEVKALLEETLADPSVKRKAAVPKQVQRKKPMSHRKKE